MSIRGDGHTVGEFYIAMPSMNSCRCSGPNPSGQRHEVLASAEPMPMSTLAICHCTVIITYHLFNGSAVVKSMAYQNAPRQRVYAVLGQVANDLRNDEHCKTSM
jgi:hypothetical protein